MMALTLSDGSQTSARLGGSPYVSVILPFSIQIRTDEQQRDEDYDSEWYVHGASVALAGLRAIMEGLN
jgi:hypothetical protein